MEILISVLIYGVQLFLLMLVSGAVYLLVRKIRGVRAKGGTFVVCLILIALVIGCICCWPAIGGQPLEQADRETISCVSQGLYSSRLPLIPVYICVEETGELLRWQIYYIPFGSIEMIHNDDGYDITKPLF